MPRFDSPFTTDGHVCLFPDVWKRTWIDHDKNDTIRGTTDQEYCVLQTWGRLIVCVGLEAPLLECDLNNAAGYDLYFSFPFYVCFGCPASSVLLIIVTALWSWAIIWRSYMLRQLAPKHAYFNIRTQKLKTNEVLLAVSSVLGRHFRNWGVCFTSFNLDVIFYDLSQSGKAGAHFPDHGDRLVLDKRKPKAILGNWLLH